MVLSQKQKVKILCLMEHRLAVAHVKCTVFQSQQTNRVVSV